MRNIFYLVTVAVVTFLILKLVIVILYKIITKIFKSQLTSDKENKFDLSMSVALYLIVLEIWFASLNAMINKYFLSDVEVYIALNISGFLSIVWCYFSWEASRILVKPRIAKSNEQRVKKIVVYSLIMIFTIYLGYHQMRSVFYDTGVSEVLALANYSIFVTAIAFDRVMNQIINKKNE